jgi:hypothetical protein
LVAERRTKVVKKALEVTLYLPCEQGFDERATCTVVGKKRYVLVLPAKADTASIWIPV